MISTLVTDENAEIDAAVSAGTLTSAQAAQMKAQTTQRVTDMVNGTAARARSRRARRPGRHAG